MFANKGLLITGGTSTFRNAILKPFLQTNIAELTLDLVRDELRDRVRVARPAETRP